MKNNSLFTIALASLALTSLTGCGQKDDPRPLTEQAKDSASNAVDHTKAAAIDAKNAVSDKLVEWKLTPSDIKADLEKGGRVVRTKTASASAKVGGAVDNARVVTVINGKLVADHDLSALKINVDADSGVVTLKGTVSSVELIGRAIALALDTDGVNEVDSLLTVEAK